MSDRREFLKHAGLLGVLPLPKGGPGLFGADAEDEQGEGSAVEAGAVILENTEMRLVITPNASAESLIHKPTSQECLLKARARPCSP